MKISNILLSVALTISVVDSKVLNSNNIKRQVGNGSPEHIDYKHFSYNFNCLEDNNGSCNIVKESLNDSIDVLESTFEFYNTIVFDVFVDNWEKYEMKAVGGIVIDTQYIALKTGINEPPYIYSQALAKQLNLNKPVEFKENDFNIIVTNKIQEKDILYRLITHEMVHGLGFIDVYKMGHVSDGDSLDRIGMVNYNFNTNSNLTDVKILPRPLVQYDLENMKNCRDFNRGTVIGFSPMTVFEKNIVDINSKIKVLGGLENLYQEFSCLNDPNISDKDNIKEKCYEKVSLNSKKLMTEIPLKYYMKQDSIGFLTNNDSVVPLYTFNSKYISGSSVCHTNSDYYGYKYEEEEDFEHYKEELKSNLKRNSTKTETEINNFVESTEVKETYWEGKLSKYINENFLMNWVYLDKFSTEYLIKTLGKYNRHGLIGNGIVDILKTIGLTEKGEMKSNQIYYIADDIKYPEQNTLKQIFKKKELKCISGSSNININISTTIIVSILLILLSYF
ncbi:hypothetical protein PIROE2DRAFT_12088 [Piromyces sp. E2]|nr:hypothetical protein PIROE2DRAFT_12088 [Piromyces sp. E2]|eukprot:OUM61833.1 hypothetical protein PIROE2DRAFT_12088 [Piromyces sp. E2]